MSKREASFRYGLLVVLLLGAALAQATGAASEPPKVERLPIVEKAIAFHGGDRFRFSDTELKLCSRSGCFDLQVRTEGDLFAHTVEGRSGGELLKVRVTNRGVERWQDGEASPVEGGEEQRWRDWTSARVYFPFLPHRLSDASVYKQDLGLETWDGRSLHKVKVTFAADSSTNHDDEYLYWFDPESGRLELFAYSFKGNPGGLRFRRAINYRRVEGLLFFDQENLGIDADNLKVDSITPELVRDKMRLVSTVRLADIEVRPLKR